MQKGFATRLPFYIFDTINIWQLLTVMSHFTWLTLSGKPSPIPLLKSAGTVEIKQLKLVGAIWIFNFQFQM